MATRFESGQRIFISECRVARWEDGRLAAKPLFEALRAMGVDPTDQVYVNLWTDPPTRRGKNWRPTLCSGIVIGLRIATLPKVALGARVSTQLTKLGIKHVAIVHPAARGSIRKRERYIAHVAATLRQERNTP